MFNNIVLDVAIGLVFIYLLYSLLAATINEFVATIFDYRPRMLERGVEQMLDGKNYSYYWWDRLWNYLYPANKERPRSKFYKKKAAFTHSIVCHQLYIRAAENTLWSHKPSYLSATVFSDILLDLLKPDPNVPALLKDIELNIKARAADQNDPLHPDLAKLLNIYIEQANGDLQRFKLLLENWYDETMNRVTGWYKKQSNWILMLIGLILAVIFNVSTIEIIAKLSKDKGAREAMVNNASEYIKSVEANSPLAPAGETEKNVPPPAKAVKGEKKDSAAEASAAASAKAPTTTKDTAASAAKASGTTTTTASKTTATPPATAIKDTTAKDATFEKAKLQLARIKKLYDESIVENNEVLGLGWGDYGYAEDSIKWVQKGAIKKDKPERPGFFGKVGHVLYETLFTPRRLLGFLITALAISLGAPFWFDLLNKFINLRVSGAKPATSPTTGTAAPVSKTVLLNRRPDPNAKG